jgi:predicted TIM-barrel fold metal-dependent hydrolase
MRESMEATGGRRMASYIERRGVTLSSGWHFLERLTGRRAVRDPMRFAWLDHPSLWIKAGKPFSFVSQPYGLSLQDLREIVAYCEEHDLDVSVDAGASWHYPGATVAVEFTRRD